MVTTKAEAESTPVRKRVKERANEVQRMKKESKNEEEEEEEEEEEKSLGRRVVIVFDDDGEGCCG